MPVLFNGWIWLIPEIEKCGGAPVGSGLDVAFISRGSDAHEAKRHEGDDPRYGGTKKDDGQFVVSTRPRVDSFRVSTTNVRPAFDCSYQGAAPWP